MCNLKYFTKEIEKGCFSKLTEALKPRSELIFCCQTAKENIFLKSLSSMILSRVKIQSTRKFAIGQEAKTFPLMAHIYVYLIMDRFYLISLPGSFKSRATRLHPADIQRTWQQTQNLSH